MSLTTRTLTNTGAPLCGPNGAPLAAVDIVFELHTEAGAAADVWDAITFERVLGTTRARTNSAGEFTAQLWPNSRGNVATHYKCTVNVAGFPSIVGVVEDVSAPLTWVQFMATQTPITPQELSQLATYLQQIEDARDTAQAAASTAAAAAVASTAAINALSGVSAQTLAGDLELALDSDGYQFLDPAGATRAVTLPAGATPGRGFCVKNSGTAGFLRVNAPGGAQLGMLIIPGYAVVAIYTGTTWELL